MTGVAISSLRVFGQTESFGFVSNSHSFSPDLAAYPRTHPSPWALTTCSTPPIVPTLGVDHWPCRIRSSTELSSHSSFPVFLFRAMIAGALGDGIWTWLSSCPLDVLMNTRSPRMTGEEFDMLCGYEPTSSIMSNDQITSASCSLVSFSSVTGPSFLPSRNPLMSRHQTTPRLLV